MEKQDSFTLIDVTLRDGLQRLPNRISVSTKLEFVRRLTELQIFEFEVGSFVHPRIINMQNTADVLSQLLSIYEENARTRMWVMIPNHQGLDKSLAFEHKNLGRLFFMSIIEDFNQKNVGMSVSDNFRQISLMQKSIHSIQGVRKINLVGALGTDTFPPDLGLTKNFLDFAVAEGFDFLGISDTFAVGTTASLTSVLELALTRFSAAQISLHLHIGDNQIVEMIDTAWRFGIRSFETSFLSTGGCVVLDNHPNLSPVILAKRCQRTFGVKSPLAPFSPFSELENWCRKLFLTAG